MIFLAQSLASWIAAALALGLAFGFMAARRGGDLFGRGAGFVLAVLYGCGLAVAALELAPGQYGFWLEAGLLVFGAYALGGWFGGALAHLLRPSARASHAAGPPPEWLAAAKDLAGQAEAFSAVAPLAAAAFDAAGDALATIAAPRFPREDAGGRSLSNLASAAVAADRASARVSVAVEPPPELAVDDQNDLDLIHGLDPATARALRGLGLSCLTDLARADARREREIAERLGRGGAVVAYWTAQARLLAHGVETEFSRERLARAGASPAAFEEPALDDGAALALSAGLPQAAPRGAHDSLYPGERPFGLLAPPGGAADDLSRIAGLDEAAAQRLNLLGVWTFRQIAAWSLDNSRWVDSFLASPGLVARAQWREQAAALAGRASRKQDI